MIIQTYHPCKPQKRERHYSNSRHRLYRLTLYSDSEGKVNTSGGNSTVDCRTMAQAASLRPLTAEVRVRAQVNPCGFCGVQSVTGTGFSREFFDFPINIMSPSVSILISCGDQQYVGQWQQFRYEVSPNK
jgi:hypothetical protein